MCRWVAHIGEEVYLNTILIDCENSLIKQSISASKGDPAVNGDGFGLSWYTEKDQPALYRDVMPAWHDINMLELSEHIKSNLFFGHIRAATGTSTSRENCHPFRHENYIFMHNGMIQNYDRYKRKIESNLSDEFYQLKKGSTDSEVIFYLLLQYGFFENPSQSLNKLIKTIETTLEENKNPEKNDYFRMTFCISDSKNIYMARYSTNENPPSAFYRKTEKGWIISSEPTHGNINLWKKAPDKCLMKFSKNSLYEEVIEL